MIIRKNKKERNKMNNELTKTKNNISENEMSKKETNLHLEEIDIERVNEITQLLELYQDPDLTLLLVQKIELIDYLNKIVVPNSTFIEFFNRISEIEDSEFKSIELDNYVTSIICYLVKLLPVEILETEKVYTKYFQFYLQDNLVPLNEYTPYTYDIFDEIISQVNNSHYEGVE